MSGEAASAGDGLLEPDDSTRYGLQLMLAYMLNMFVSDAESPAVVQTPGRAHASHVWSPSIRKFQVAGGTAIWAGDVETTTNITNSSMVFPIRNDDVVWPVCHAGESRSQSVYAYMKALSVTFRCGVPARDRFVVLRPHGTESGFLPDLTSIAFMPSYTGSTDSTYPGFATLVGGRVEKAVGVHPGIGDIGKLAGILGPAADSGQSELDIADWVEQFDYFVSVVGKGLKSLVYDVGKRLVIIAFDRAADAMVKLLFELEETYFKPHRVVGFMSHVTLVAMKMGDDITSGNNYPGLVSRVASQDVTLTYSGRKLVSQDVVLANLMVQYREMFPPVSYDREFLKSVAEQRKCLNSQLTRWVGSPQILRGAEALVKGLQAEKLVTRPTEVDKDAIETYYPVLRATFDSRLGGAGKVHRRRRKSKSKSKSKNKSKVHRASEFVGKTWFTAG